VRRQFAIDKRPRRSKVWRQPKHAFHALPRIWVMRFLNLLKSFECSSPQSPRMAGFTGTARARGRRIRSTIDLQTVFPPNYLPLPAPGPVSSKRSLVVSGPHLHRFLDLQGMPQPPRLVRRTSSLICKVLPVLTDGPLIQGKCLAEREAIAQAVCWL
jgi:hypothetical protein